MSKARNIADLLDSSGKVTADDLDVGAIGGRRNLIINGAMQIAQRGTSIGPSLSSSQYLLDRWFLGGSTSNLTITQESDVTVNGTPSNTFKATASGSTTLDCYQAIEDWRLLSGKTVTISFWYRTNATGFVLRHYNTEDVATVNNTNGTWTYFTTTYTFGTTASNPRGANGGTIGFWKKDGGNLTNGEYLEFTQYQLELGSVATPFEHRRYGEELALCQRYYEVIKHTGRSLVNLGQNYQNRKYMSPFMWKVTKRATPTSQNVVFYIDGGDGTHTFQPLTTVDMLCFYSTTTSPNIGSSDVAYSPQQVIYGDAEL